MPIVFGNIGNRLCQSYFKIGIRNQAWCLKSNSFVAPWIVSQRHFHAVKKPDDEDVPAHGDHKLSSIEARLQILRMVDRLYDNNKDAMSHERYLKQAPFMEGKDIDFHDFLLADADGDGKVSNVEWENYLRKRKMLDANHQYSEPYALNVEIPLAPSQAHSILNEGDGLHVHINGMRYGVSLTPEGDTKELIDSKRSLLKQTISELASMEIDKRPLDGRAARHTKRVLTVALLYLLGQASVIAKLTFFSRFGWDVMEPITYFITFGTAILGFVFFQYHKIEYSYPALAALLTQRKAKRLYRKYDFDIDKYNDLQDLAVKYQKQLAVLEPPQSMIARAIKEVSS